MPHGEEVSSTLLVKVGGTELPADVAALLVHGQVDDSSNVPDRFLLRFNDEHGTVLAKGRLEIAAKVDLLVKSSAPGAPQPLLSGEVTSLEVELTEQGQHAVVRGLDRSHRLFRGSHVEAYLNMTASDIVRKVAQRAGVEIEVEATTLTYEHLAQDGVSDWELLTRLARENNRVVAISDGRLRFTSRTPAGEAPSGREGAREEPTTLERGVNLLHLRATVTSSGQVPSIEVRGWNPKDKRAEVDRQTPQPVHAALSATPTGLAGLVAAPTRLVPSPHIAELDRCRQLATSYAEHLAGGYAELEGTARGNPRLRAGTAVALANVGSTFDGKYTLSSTRHDFTPDDGYLVRFAASNDSERSLLGAASGGSRARRVSGTVPAIVTNTKDPEQQGRVKLRFPWLSDSFEGPWARVLQPGAGKGRGLTLLPEVNDEVLVGFAMEDFDHPYVLGGLHNGQDLPDPGWADHVDSTDGSVKRRGWTSRTGMDVEFLESPQEERLVVSTNAGAQRVELTQTGSKGIHIVSEGALEVTARNDITLSTGSGNLDLKGTNVTVEATGALDLKGMNVKVAGSATSELSGGASATVKAAMVRIN